LSKSVAFKIYIIFLVFPSITKYAICCVRNQKLHWSNKSQERKGKFNY
jgi:hypothetical protein